MSEVLKHYGIKGMKWGVRRTPEQLGHATARKKPSGENKPAKKASAKKTPGKSARRSTSLSDEDLQRRINRLTMEKKYDELVEEQKKRNSGMLAKGKKIIYEGFEEFGKGLIKKGVAAMLDRIGQDKLEDYIIQDPSKARTEQLKKATEWFNAQRAYDEARNPKKTERIKTSVDYDSPLDLDDETLGKVVKRLQNENSFYNQWQNRTLREILDGRGPVQDALAKMMARDRDEEV